MPYDSRPDDSASLESVLRDTLDDRRLSRSERRALGGVFEAHANDASGRARLRNLAFTIARDSIDAANPQEARKVLSWIEDVVKLLVVQPSDAKPPENEAYFSPGDACQKKIRSLLRSANRSVDICVFTITDNRISREIEDAHRRRVDVRILTDNDKSEDLGSDIDDLRHRGVPVAVDESEKHMHHKFAIFDRKILLTGSYNWTRSAATENEENIITSDDPNLVRSFSSEFESLWKKFSR